MSKHLLEEFQAGDLVGGRYRILEELGRGGMGVVYVAKDQVLSREVAVKSISATSFAKTESERERARRENRGFDEDLFQQFKAEALATARLSVENVVVVHDAGDHQGIPYLVMERLYGEDLEHFLKKRQGRPLPLEEAVEIILEVCFAIGKAHAFQIYHRDLSARNVFVLQDMIKVLDFGLARLRNEARQTQQGYVRGTWPYTAPERFEGHDGGALGDVYSIGVLLYETTTGGLPFVNPQTGVPLTGDSLVQVIMSGRYLPPKERNPSLPAGLVTVIQRAMAKDLRNRFPSVHVLGRELLPFAPGIGRKYREYFLRSEPVCQRIEVLTGGTPLLEEDDQLSAEDQKVLEQFREKMPFAEGRAGAPLGIVAELGGAELMRDERTAEAKYDASTRQGNIGPGASGEMSGRATAPERPGGPKSLGKSSEQWFGEAQSAEALLARKSRTGRRTAMGVGMLVLVGVAAAVFVARDRLGVTAAVVAGGGGRESASNSESQDAGTPGVVQSRENPTPVEEPSTPTAKVVADAGAPEAPRGASRRVRPRERRSAKREQRPAAAEKRRREPPKTKVVDEKTGLGLPRF